MSTEQESQFELEGIKLYSKTWTPEGPIKAKIVFVHGFSDHVNCYNEFFRLLAARGIQVFAWDQRGWGKSALDRSQWGMTGPTIQVIADVAAFVKKNLSDRTLPLFVMGHSMGGGEVATLMADPQYEDLVGQVRGWILESPFIGFSKGAEPSFITVFFGRLAGKLLPRHQLKHHIPPEHFTRDQAVVEAIKADPMCHETGTLEGLAGLLDRTGVLASGTSKVVKGVRSILLAHGTGDLTCSYDAAMKWLEGQAVNDKTAKSYEGAYHQLHTDHCKGEFTDDVANWILARIDTPIEPKL